MKKIIPITLALCIVFFNNSNIFSQSNWLQQNSGTYATLWSIDFVTENTGFIACSDGQILKTTNAGSNWIMQHAGYNNFIGIDFINPMTGWVSGHSGTIFKTTNGGLNWINQISPTNVNLFFVQFINEQTGYISSDAGVIKTTNGGQDWFF